MKSEEGESWKEGRNSRNPCLVWRSDNLLRHHERREWPIFTHQGGQSGATDRWKGVCADWQPKTRSGLFVDDGSGVRPSLSGLTER
jgi:hypothetical protein